MKFKTATTFDRPRRWALVVSIALAGAFLYATVPPAVPSASGPSDVQAIGPDGLEFGIWSLVTTPPGPVDLNSASFVNTPFAVEFVARPAMSGRSYVGSILSYSTGPEFNWAVEQHNESLAVLHRNRSARFTGVISPGKSRHYLYVATADGAALYADGVFAGSAAWDRPPRDWAFDARLVIGNLDLGDYPWAGQLELLRLYASAPDASDAAGIHRSYLVKTARSDAVLRLAIPTTGQYRLEAQDGTSIPFHSYEWPRIIKLENILRLDKQIFNGTDMFLNFVATFFLGVALAAFLAGRAPGVVILQVTLTACSLSLIAELLQFFSPQRIASLVDVVMNTLGASIGAALQISYAARKTRGPN